MFRSATLLAMTAMTSLLAAEDFGPVVKAVNQVYQGKTHYGVVCNYSHSQKEVADLHRALPDGTTLTVIDVRHPMNLGPAATLLRQRRIELLALMPNDPLVRDGSAFATALVDQVNDRIPAFGTTPAALKNGCALAMGAATNWKLLTNPKAIGPDLRGTIGPVEVTRVQFH